MNAHTHISNPTVDSNFYPFLLTITIRGLAVVCPIYKCDEDTLPVVVDLLKIFNEPADHRQAHLEEVSSLLPAPSFEI